MLSTLVAAGHMVVFFGTWIIAMLEPPMLVIFTVCLLVNASATLEKMKLGYYTLLYLLTCNDRSGFKLPKEVDPGNAMKAAKENDASKPTKKVQSKTIVFIRHGESTWNDTFNKGADRSKMNFILYFIPNLLYAIYMELYHLASGQPNESWFYDSPLSAKGVSQAHELRNFLVRSSVNDGSVPSSDLEIIRLILGMDDSNGSYKKKTEPRAQLVSSNLRRAISTMTLSLQPRLSKRYSNDTVEVMTELQEISRNPDALSITPPNGVVLPSPTDIRITDSKNDGEELKRVYREQISTRFHTGNKSLATSASNSTTKSTAVERLTKFCQAVFTKFDKDVVICTGHSLYFKCFFQLFLPRDSTHVGKKKKIVNCGVVSFTLNRLVDADDGSGDSSKGKDDDGGVSDIGSYWIDPTSIKVIYRGFN